MSKKFLRITYITLTLLVMITIFLLSNQNGESSNKISEDLTMKNFDIISNITSNKDDLADSFLTFHRLLRKTAHFVLYFLLSIFSFLTFKSFDLKPYYSIIFCLIYAISDEIHQLFVIGRSSSFKDVLIDMAGSLVAFIILYIIFKRKHRAVSSN